MINLLVLELSNLIGPLIHEKKFLLLHQLRALFWATIIRIYVYYIKALVGYCKLQKGLCTVQSSVNFMFVITVWRKDHNNAAAEMLVACSRWR